MIILDKILGKKSANMNQIFISRIGHLASLLVIVSFYSSLQYRKIFFSDLPAPSPGRSTSTPTSAWSSSGSQTWTRPPTTIRGKDTNLGLSLGAQRTPNFLQDAKTKRDPDGPDFSGPGINSICQWWLLSQDLKTSTSSVFFRFYIFRLEQVKSWNESLFFESVKILIIAVFHRIAEFGSLSHC